MFTPVGLFCRLETPLGQYVRLNDSRFLSVKGHSGHVDSVGTLSGFESQGFWSKIRADNTGSHSPPFIYIETFSVLLMLKN